MRSFFLITALCALFFTACQPDDNTETFAVMATPDSFSEMTDPACNKSMTTTIKNTSSVSGEVSWDLAETQMVAGWTYTIVVGNTLQSGMSGKFDLDAGASMDVTVTAMPNGTSGTGKATLTLKDGDNELTNVMYTVETGTATQTFTLSKTTDAGTVRATNTKVEYKTTVTNTTGNDLNMTWVRTNTTPVSTWDVDVCDINLCYAPTVSTKDFVLPANSSFDMKIGFQPNSTMGTGTTQVELYETGQSCNKQIFTVTHTAN